MRIIFFLQGFSVGICIEYLIRVEFNIFPLLIAVFMTTGVILDNVYGRRQIRNSSESITSESLPESRLKARSTSGCKD